MSKYCTRVKLTNEKESRAFIYDFKTYGEAEHFIELVTKYVIEHHLPIINHFIYPLMHGRHKFQVEPNQKNLKNILVINDLLLLSGR